MSKTDVLIIGGGPAGITFARKLKKLKPELDIIMFRPESHSMVYCAIPYAIEGLFEPSKVLKRDELVTDAGIELLRRRVTEVDLQAMRVRDETGEEYEAAVVFIATGASPIRPPVPGADAANVFTVKQQEDMEGLIHCVEQGAKRAVVVGAGAIGIEQAQAYRTRGLDVTLIDMADRALPSLLDADMAEAVHDTLTAQGIDLRLLQRVKTLGKTGEKVSAVFLSDGSRIDLDPDTDFVCFAVGMGPDVDLFRDEGLKMNRDGIVVDNRMRTNIAGVYAAGDCCSYVSGIDEKPIGGKLATNAVPMAKTAARVVAGKDDEYAGFFNGAATCAYDLRVGSTGFTEQAALERGFTTIVGYGETTTLFPMMPGAGNLKVKIVADKHDFRIIGGQVVSTLPTTDKVDVITLAIQRRMTLKGLAKLSYSAQPWQSFFPARSAIVEACENALNNFADQCEPFHYPELMECV
jgi:NADPH-dependent 2,4-dienoyl-CoA reductase/sulfur reductase-like enzyme